MRHRDRMRIDFRCGCIEKIVGRDGTLRGLDDGAQMFSGRHAAFAIAAHGGLADANGARKNSFGDGVQG